MSASKQNSRKATAPKTNYVLVDYENVPVRSLGQLAGEHFRVTVFLGPNNTRLPVDLVLAMQKLGERGQYVQMAKAGGNALDFHVAYYLGALSKTDPAGIFHVISRDTGFDPLIAHLQAGKVQVSRSASIDAMPCFQQKKSARQAPRMAASVADEPDELIREVVVDLARRKAAKPRTEKTLLSTIHAKLGKERPVDDIELVLQGLQVRGYVAVEGGRVSYALPEA